MQGLFVGGDGFSANLSEDTQRLIALNQGPRRPGHALPGARGGGRGLLGERPRNWGANGAAPFRQSAPPVVPGNYPLLAGLRGHGPVPLYPSHAVVGAGVFSLAGTAGGSTRG
jgi:hypothetical protein